MSIYDRWHKEPEPGDESCKCGSTRRPLYPSADHKKGDRWQVRWRDENKKQRKKNFAKKEGKNPDIHADAFDAKIAADLDAGTYVDPANGDITFEEYAESWRKARTHGETTGINVEHQFRLHVYPDPENAGRSRRGGPALGHHKMRNLARQPSLCQQWIAGMKLGDSTKVKVIDRVSEVFSAAVDDGLIPRNPLYVKSVQRPEPDKHEVVLMTVGELDALSLALRHMPGCKKDCDECGASRYEILPYLGAATGQRQGEMFAIDVDQDLDFLRRVIHVRRQVKIIRGRQAACLSAGLSVRAVAECLGDTEATVQATYSHLMPDDTDRVRKAMGRFFTRPGTKGRKASAARDVP
jgi:hypothetical protein